MIRRLGHLTLCICAALIPVQASAKALPILPDGFFKDWKPAGKPFVDPAGDAPADRIDLGKLWIANDDEALYLRFQVGRETLLQETGAIGNDLRLYLDTDRKGATGMPVEGIGAEIEIRFGEREIFFYDRDGSGVAGSPGAGATMGFPTHTSGTFEVRIALPPAANPNKRRRIRLVLREASAGGDRLPDEGARTYKFPKRQRVGLPEPITLERHSATSVRLLSLNVEQSTLIQSQALYRRLLQALEPEVMAFQELTGWSARQAADFVAGALAHPTGGEWSASVVEDVVVVSAYPILAAAAIDANQVVHIDLPDELTPHDLVLFNAHPPCCTNDSGRDREIDNLMVVWRDLLAGNGPFAIDPMDAVVITGDFNLVGYRRQYDAIVDGTFIDSANGPDFAPGRANGSLAATPLRHTHRRFAYTWRNEFSSFTPGRLDFVFFSDDVAEAEKSFIFDTTTMPSELLDPLGLDTGDSLRVSDHLPLIVDFEFSAP